MKKIKKIAILGAGREGKSVKKYLLAKKLFKKERHKVQKNSIFTQENFLDSGGRFKVN